jgi:hypothetical protein
MITMVAYTHPWNKPNVKANVDRSSLNKSNTNFSRAVPTSDVSKNAQASAPSVGGINVSGQSSSTKTILTTAQIAYLNSLVVANGGSANTIPNIINNANPVSLQDTINKLSTSPNYPPILVGLLRRYNITGDLTVEQSLLSLYTYTSQLSSTIGVPTATNLAGVQLE